MKKTSELLISVIEKNFTKYQLIEKIGEGVSSVVYSAYFTDANSIVTKKALKIINLSSRNSKRNYQREIKAHSILQTHESILSINDHMVFKHKGIQYGVLEFDLMDVDLMDVILRKNQSGNNTVNKKKHKENNLLSSLPSSFILPNHIAHLDIKADNILINSSNNIIKDIKLIDFGSSRKNNSNLTSKLYGTKEYLPIEYYTHSHPVIAEKSDIWSLGVLLFTMITGCYPFQYKSKACMSVGLDLILEKSDNDIKCFNLLKEIFSIDPDDRPSIEQVLDHPWLR